VIPIVNSVTETRKDIHAKPFLKWAGGKTQLLDELVKRLPQEIKNTRYIDSYIEPFVGGGAMFFYLKTNFNVKKSFLFDINRELIVGYKVVQNNPKELTGLLKEIEKEYLSRTDEKQKEYYYEIRKDYNKQMLDFDYTTYKKEWITRASHLIFLNKTCFNGLFRQNKKGGFNVPHGGYKNPSICCTENIIQVHEALKDTEIFCDDFTKSERYIKEKCFVYFDPPYLPLNQTSSFTSYSKEDFTRKDQIRLADFFKKMDKRGDYLMMSNSDPKNENPDDNFFDELYEKYTIDRVLANRMINCNGRGRGLISELIITNYKFNNKNHENNKK